MYGKVWCVYQGYEGCKSSMSLMSNASGVNNDELSLSMVQSLLTVRIMSMAPLQQNPKTGDSMLITSCYAVCCRAAFHGRDHQPQEDFPFVPSSGSRGPLRLDVTAKLNDFPVDFRFNLSKQLRRLSFTDKALQLQAWSRYDQQDVGQKVVLWKLAKPTK